MVKHIMIRILQMGMIFMYSLYVGLTALGKELLLSSLFQIDTLNNRFAVGIDLKMRSLRSFRVILFPPLGAGVHAKNSIQ